MTKHRSWIKPSNCVTRLKVQGRVLRSLVLMINYWLFSIKGRKVFLRGHPRSTSVSEISVKAPMMRVTVGYQETNQSPRPFPNHSFTLALCRFSRHQFLKFLQQIWFTRNVRNILLTLIMKSYLCIGDSAGARSLPVAMVLVNNNMLCINLGSGWFFQSPQEAQYPPTQG